MLFNIRYFRISFASDSSFEEDMVDPTLSLI